MKVKLLSLLLISSFITYADNRNDITLNPLPSSTRIAPEDFTLKEISHFNDTSFIQYFGVGDTDLDGNPEIFISGWTFAVPEPETPTKAPFYMFEANPEQTDILSTQELFGRSDTDGTTFIRIDDYDLDGQPDVLIAGHNESPFIDTENVLYTNNGSGFDAKSFDYKMAMHEGSTGDFNNDGYPDFIGSAYNADIDASNDPDFAKTVGKTGVILYLNDTKGDFTPYILKFNRAVEGNHASDIKWIPQGSAVVFGNIDDDPEMEIIIVDSADSPTDSSYGSMSLIIDNLQFETKHFYGDVIALPDTYFRTRSQFSDNPTHFPDLLTHAIQVDLMDIDNDGDNDILVNTMIWVEDGHDAAGVIQFLRNDGEHQFTDITDDTLFNYNLSNSASHDMRIMDINDDGFLDLIGVEGAYSEAVDHMWGGEENPWQGDLYQAIDKTWANEILVNTGNGKFVSTFWDGFHQLTLQQEPIYQSYSDENPYGLSDRSYFPYMLADGRLGFVTSGGMYLDDKDNEFYFDVRAKNKFYTGPKGVQTESAIGFSEYYYLTENPAVVTAINAGTYADGLAHYIAKGKAEGKYSFAKNAKIHGSSNNDTIELREGDEKAFGYAGDDSFNGQLGNDILDGGDGVDSATYGNSLQQYTLTKAENGFQVVNQDTSVNHNLINIEKLIFDGNEYQFAAVDKDSDSDGMSNDYETANSLNTNDDSDANNDLDKDGINNLTESLMGTSANNADTDNDGANDNVDDYPLDSSKGNDTDTDGDGVNDAIDTDDDGDGVLDIDDMFPLDAAESVDTDGDGIGNNTDKDDDGDGALDADDAFSLDAAESVDTDGDGVGNNADTDDDGDGVSDTDDAYPLDSTKSVAPTPTPTEPTKSSGGGGGSISFFMLLILSLVLLPRRFIKHKN
ncbi:hypothetical protein NBRC116592_04050 [Colwellia sp. KU-HH00111]|uniref:FG-GAP-like repeat-containing protein n=1 Tax=Colwellia sp. KU-HH00111 TaxID=3127652 RepID=UPI003104C624